MGRLLLLPWATLIDSHFFVSATDGRRVLADGEAVTNFVPGKIGIGPGPPKRAREGKTWEPGERIGGRGIAGGGRWNNIERKFLFQQQGTIHQSLGTGRGKKGLLVQYKGKTL